MLKTTCTESGIEFETKYHKESYDAGYDKGYIAGLKEALTQIQLKKFEWVSVHSSLPNDGGDVLIHVDYNFDARHNHTRIHSAEHVKRKNGTYYWRYGSSKILSEDVTHWMPMPARPEDEKK